MASCREFMASDQQDLSNEPTPQPGRFGRFYLQELINRGGVNDIWVATDPERRTFALRRMRCANWIRYCARSSPFRWKP